MPFSIAIKSCNKQFENKPIKKMNDLKNASQQEKFEKPKSPLSPTVTKFVVFTF